ncbi:MAG: enoyl-CoA hydratase/isomerase family protein [Phycisphaerales bacterium]|nr:enoyl-CoA hydratase/isomerase family protein [Phycisphaerales bacterium]
MSVPQVLSEMIERAGVRVGRITLNRPEKKNALTPEMLVAVHAAVIAQSGSGEGGEAIGALVVDGHGAAFCSGFDLSLCRENSDALAELLSRLSAVVRVLKACPCPVVIAAHGAAIAGGCALLGGADVVVSHTDAKIGYPVVRLGISPAVSAPFLRLNVGDGRARERLLDPTLISGWEAARLGLVHECLEDAGKVRDRALAIAVGLASKPGPAMRATKALLNEIEGALDPARADAALAASLSLVGSAEERERLVALWKS